MIKLRLFIAMAAAVLLCNPLTAQGGRVAAWVALAPGSQPEPFRLLRFAGNAPHDVILLAPGADAASLTQAVEALLAIRRVDGDVAASQAVLRTRAGTVRARVLPWAGRVLADVRSAPARQVPSVGPVKAVRIWLPAQRRAEH